MACTQQELDAFFEHHGILGMHWGVRNADKAGPSVPTSRFGKRNLKINTDRHNLFTARAAKGNIRISELNAQIDALPPGIKGAYKRSGLKSARNATTNQMNKDLNKAKNPPTSGLTVTQKRLLIGAGVAAVVISAAYATEHFDGERVSASIRRGESFLKYGTEFKPDLSLAGDMTHQQVLKDVVKGINPNYASSGGHMNCRRCTFAYEMRRRGHDVVATTSAIGYGQNESGLVNALVKGDRNLISTKSLSEFAGLDPNSLGVRTRAARGDTRTHTAIQESVGKISELRTALAKHPKGSRGEAVFDMGDFAHSMQWEVFDDGPHIFDAQKGEHFATSADGLLKLTQKWGTPRVTHITRLDNVDLDTKFISRWVTNRNPTHDALSTMNNLLNG